ncbi:helix-turn-helix domain-containing protein [Rhodococcus sp. NPDC127530]|uniref:helix-turn-helix domain-containing protein n=1 Tax=unclassified Rhodococcus (in: high G+C Gram-positive bacteria) TaxID=192944 RepID=UPI0036440B23
MTAHHDDGGWLQLVLDEASAEDLTWHTQCLVDQGRPSEAVDRQRSMAARAIELLRQRRQRSTELSALNTIASRLSAVPDLGSLLQEIVDQARMLLGVDLAYLSLIDAQVMRIEVTSGTVSSALQGVTHPLTLGLVAEAIRRGEPVTTSSYLDDRSFVHEAGADTTMSAEGVQALIGAPLASGGHPIGMLFAAVREHRTFGIDATELMVSLAAHAAVAIENAAKSERLRAANQDLEQRSRELEQVLRWDESFTQLVLRGGGVTDLVTEISRITGTVVTFVRSIETHPHGTTARPILAGGNTLGYLLIDDQAQPDRRFLERADSALALACMAEDAVKEASRRTQDSVLIALLGRTNLEAAEFRQQAWIAGINPDVEYVVIVAEEQHHQLGGRLRLLLEEVRWPAGTVIAEYGTRVLVVAPATASEGLSRCWPDSLVGKVTAGIGSAVEAPKIATSHIEAQETLDVMFALGRSGQIGTSADLGLYRILLGGASEAQITKLITDTLGPLLEEEARRKTPLLQTLAEYLRLHQRRSATAHALNVHVNTLDQRLLAIDRILGPDWRSSDRSTDLQVVLRLRSSAHRLGERHHRRDFS